MSTAGQAAGGLVGGIAGFFLSGGNPTGAIYGAQIGMTLGGLLDPPKGPTVDGPGLDDLTVQTSTYGATIPRVYGTIAVNGSVFWLENNALKQTITRKKSGGKGGGSTTTTRVKTYSATFAVGLCKGPIVGVRRIWIGGVLYYDAGSSDPGTIQASSDAAAGFEVYAGTDTQLPDARMQATLGAANTPAWRGLAYIVFYDLPLAKYGNSLMGAQVRVEVMTTEWSHTYPYEVGSLSVIKAWTRPAWNGSVWCMVAQATGRSAVSSDGLSWSEYTGLPTKDWMDIAAIGSTFVAIALNTNVCYSSSDGITWSSNALPSTKNWSSICSNGSVIVAVGNDTAATSGNGLTWVGYTLSSGNDYLGTLAWNGSLFAISYRRSSSSYVATSPSGSAWTEYLLPRYSVSWLTMGAKGSQFCLTSTNASDGVCLSANGSTWTRYATLLTHIDGIASDGSVYLAVGGGSYLTSYDGQTWTDNPLAASIASSANGVGWNGSTFVYSSSAELKSVLVRPTIYYPITLTLGNVVSTECLQSGILTAGDIDVTGLTAQVRGYAVGSIGAIRAALEPIQACWPFDVRQHGYQIQFIARGGSSVVTIPASDLDARDSGAEPGVQITTSREMDSQLPRRVTVNYLDVDREYNRGTQYAERLTTPSIHSVQLDLPIVLTSTEGAGKAEVLLYLYWLERHDVSITLPPTYNHLEAGDVVTLVTPEGNVSLRLTATNYTSAGRVECKAKYANAAIYTPTAVAASPSVTGPTTITPVGASIYALLDLPQISTAQSSPSFLVAMTGALSGWDGGVLMQSTDAGATWAQLQNFDAPGTTIGTASNSLGSVDSRVIDNGSLLNVTLTQGELYSITQLAMFAGQNHFAYGVDGRWEIIAAQTCTLSSGTSYVLRDLLRGRFGTEWAMSLHAAGDTIVLLDTTDVALIAMGVGTIGLSYLYRGITVDRDISTDSNRAFAYLGVNLKPLSPIALTGAIDPSSNDWSLTWIRRTREGGEWRDHVDASLGETSQAYQIDVFADGTYATVKRTIATTTQDAAYSSADQVTDFGSNQTTLYLKIYQLSATVGRGYPLTQSITR